jgi:hypothetical protein
MPNRYVKISCSLLKSLVPLHETRIEESSQLDLEALIFPPSHERNLENSQITLSKWETIFEIYGGRDEATHCQPGKGGVGQGVHAHHGLAEMLHRQVVLLEGRWVAGSRTLRP